VHFTAVTDRIWWRATGAFHSITKDVTHENSYIDRGYLRASRRRNGRVCQRARDQGRGCAMVKKTVAGIKAEGAEKAYAAINAGGQFVDGEIYVVVSDFNSVTVAHATNPKLIGKNMGEAQDVDGKYFSKDMTELARKQTSFWYEYKFANPVTKKIQVKDNYCEVLGSTRVCAGAYRP
jgi:signal transduction histidine kinase